MIFAVQPLSGLKNIFVNGELTWKITCANIDMGNVSQSHCSRFTVIPIRAKSFDKYGAKKYIAT